MKFKIKDINLCANLYSVYIFQTTARVPESAKHLLDDYKIVNSENPFDFHFKSVNHQRTGSV